MGISALVFWAWAFMMVASGAAAFVAGMIVLFLGLMRSSKKTSWLGVLIGDAGLLVSAPCILMWLDQFHRMRPARWMVQCGLVIGIVALALAFAAFVKCSWNEGRWNLALLPR